MKTIKTIAFTLAEVLITLGIIGITAALTMPALIAVYKEKVFVTSAKKGYSTVTNAINKWNADNGFAGDYLYFWQRTNDEIINDLAEILNSAAVCTNYNVNKCGGEYTVKAYKKLNDGYGNTKTEKGINSNRIVLADGSFVSVLTESVDGSCAHPYFSYEQDENGNYIKDNSSQTGYKGQYKIGNNCGYIYIDTNGLKGPNQTGIDYFIISNIQTKFSSNTNTMGNLDYVLSNNKLIKTEKYSVGKY